MALKSCPKSNKSPNLVILSVWEREGAFTYLMYNEGDDDDDDAAADRIYNFCDRRFAIQRLRGGRVSWGERIFNKNIVVSAQIIWQIRIGKDHDELMS